MSPHPLTATVHKKGFKDNVENYRTISLISLIMKTFEKIVKQDLLFRTAHLLDKRQHGFLATKSCYTNMIGFTDSVVLSINPLNSRPLKDWKKCISTYMCYS